MPDGCMRYTTNTNAGSPFTHVKNDHLRVADRTHKKMRRAELPVRGHHFTPPRRTTVAPSRSRLADGVFRPTPAIHEAR
jgi:hypothetical protein